MECWFQSKITKNSLIAVNMEVSNLNLARKWTNTVQCFLNLVFVYFYTFIKYIYISPTTSVWFHKSIYGLCIRIAVRFLYARRIKVKIECPQCLLHSSMPARNLPSFHVSVRLRAQSPCTLLSYRYNESLIRIWLLTIIFRVKKSIRL